MLYSVLIQRRKNKQNVQNSLQFEYRGTLRHQLDLKILYISLHYILI